VLRSLAPQDFIQLPPLGEAGTLTLVEELEAVARRLRVSDEAKTALTALLERTGRLERAIAARERAGSSADPRARAADRALDDAWGALQTWLLGWTRLPDHAHPHVDDARKLYAGLFPKGLQFLTLEFKDEWTESKNRLDQIEGHGLDRLLDALGGRAFLTSLRAAHRAYGDALQITGEDPEADALVRRALAETHMALREYVAQVAAMVRRNDAASVEAASELLGPLSERS